MNHENNTPTFTGNWWGTLTFAIIYAALNFTPEGLASKTFVDQGFALSFFIQGVNVWWAYKCEQIADERQKHSINHMESTQVLLIILSACAFMDSNHINPITSYLGSVFLVMAFIYMIYEALFLAQLILIQLKKHA